ncbi:tRNA 2-selenouridine(34) synthase MnmH [Helicobacter sp. 12S02634-8]|uniref:tRNA 2-selenouridine(34) synthase MnmH n=1 Tax=Helicobacter sp. 12S02634-8 TaxID=1476199 RepID=UPI000BA6D796|nr:tRNA 2-selenouridine(34) synthase MnmH [Helicobacter sp. 12S02634-8]PAF46851.1 tRNA 2-selenouridine(34) synthase MnmH [Helicobacter sp. 12S02634-8]
MINPSLMGEFLAEFDGIIDVRTPLEYAHSHIPNAINLPVLNNQERTQIGTIYKQESPLKAKILGASMACKNIAHILASLPDDKPLQALLHHKNKLLVYCARGGKRSEALQNVLCQIGLRIQKLPNGYKGYRNEVLKYLNTPLKQHFITLCGPTGCGKSEIIQDQSSWSIDLEGLARHYGSSFGNVASYKQGQPTQKMFENTLFADLSQKAHLPILLIEAESRKIGALTIPRNLFNAYQSHTIILIQAPLESRIQRIVKMYQNITETSFALGMQTIKPYISHHIFYEIQSLWKQKALDKIAMILIEKYYDKVYRIPNYTHTLTHTNLPTTIPTLLAIKNHLSQTL